MILTNVHNELKNAKGIHSKSFVFNLKSSWYWAAIIYIFCKTKMVFILSRPTSHYRVLWMKYVCDVWSWVWNKVRRGSNKDIFFYADVKSVKLSCRSQILFNIWKIVLCTYLRSDTDNSVISECLKTRSSFW